MSVTYGFYDSLNHDRKYNAMQMSSIFDGIINDGVFMSIGDRFNVTSDGTSMFVTVGTGRAWFDHTWTLNDSLLPIEIAQSELILNRYDAIVLETNSELDVRENSIKVITGSPSSNPVYPTLIDTQFVHQYPLAYIYVGRGVTTIRQADITSMVGKGNTPYVTGIIDTIDIEDMVSKWEDQWEKFFEDETNDMKSTNSKWKEEWDTWFNDYTSSGSVQFNNWMIEQRQVFVTWFEEIRDQLDKDAAGHLQNEINAIRQQAGLSKNDSFSEDLTYEVNDYCIYNNSLYKFISVKEPGEWDSEVVKETSITSELKEIFRALGGLSFIKITEADYKDLPVKDENTVYISPKEG